MVTTNNLVNILQELRTEFLIKERYLNLGIIDVIVISSWSQEDLFDIDEVVYTTIWENIACVMKGEYYNLLVEIRTAPNGIVSHKITKKTIISPYEYGVIYDRSIGINRQEEAIEPAFLYY